MSRYQPHHRIGMPTRLDGMPDQRYQMPQVVKTDGTRDERFNLFHKPEFGSYERFTTGQSQHYDNKAPSGPGVYSIATSTMGEPGRPHQRYVGMSGDVHTRIGQHARVPDNIERQMNQAQYHGQNTYVATAPARSRDEAIAQEKYLLQQQHPSWNTQQNPDGPQKYWWPGSKLGQRGL